MLLIARGRVTVVGVDPIRGINPPGFHVELPAKPYYTTNNRLSVRNKPVTSDPGPRRAAD
jgi:hypothetical protein